MFLNPSGTWLQSTGLTLNVCLDLSSLSTESYLVLILTLLWQVVAMIVLSLSSVSNASSSFLFSSFFNKQKFFLTVLEARSLGLLWQSSGKDSAVPLHGAKVRPLEGELRSSISKQCREGRVAERNRMLKHWRLEI